jgi:hypothetical protein
MRVCNLAITSQETDVGPIWALGTFGRHSAEFLERTGFFGDSGFNLSW